MLKKIGLSFSLLLASCAWFEGDYDGYICPNVSIPREKAYVTQKVTYEDEFQIELKGYEGYCYPETASNRHYAVITPQFEVQRLRDSDETQVDFNFYTETIKGPPEYLGKHSYSASVNIPADVKEKNFNGRAVKVKIPADNPDFEIILALDVSLEEFRYNQRTFDVKYRYNVQNDPMYMETTRVRAVEQLDAEPEVSARPQSEKSSCGGCSLFK